MTKLTAISMIVNGKRTTFFQMLPAQTRANGDIKAVIPANVCDKMMRMAGANRGDTVTIG